MKKVSLFVLLGCCGVVSAANVDPALPPALAGIDVHNLMPKVMKSNGVALLDAVLNEKDWVVYKILKAQMKIDCIFDRIYKFDFDKELDGLKLSEEQKKALKEKWVKRTDAQRENEINRIGKHVISATVLAEVSQFFTTLHNFRNLLEPMVNESLSGAGLDFSKSLLYQFLHATPEAAPTFFEKNVNTRDQMLTTCVEIKVFFQDMAVTMPGAFAKGQKLFDQVKKDEAAAKEQEEKLKQEPVKPEPKK